MPVSDIHTLLRQYWGYDTFRDQQEAVIRSVLAGNETLAILPTGTGKSLCYQVSGLALGGLTLVISPLIALIKDQLYGMEQRGIPATAIYGSVKSQVIAQRLRACQEGKFHFLLLAPERLASPIFYNYLSRLPIRLVCVDEAHCISEWGPEFRPIYLKIRQSLSSLGNDVRWLALTATAPPKVEADIIQALAFRNPVVFKTPFGKDNLTIRKIFSERKDLWLSHLLKERKSSGIIYVSRRNTADKLASRLRKSGYAVEAYHAGMNTYQRFTVQDRWLAEQLQFVVATSAFGLGVDKADVRWVIHYDVPPNMEAYIQEIGRAGRDGQACEAIIFVNGVEERSLQLQFEHQYPPPEMVKPIFKRFEALQITHAGKEISDSDLRKYLEGTKPSPKLQRAVIRVIKILRQHGLISGVTKDEDHWLIRLEEDALDQSKDSVLYPIIQEMIKQSRGNVIETWRPVSLSRLALSLKLDVSACRELLLQGIASELFNQRAYPLYTTFRVNDRNQQLPSVTDLLIISRSLRERESARLKQWLFYLRNKAECSVNGIRKYQGEVKGKKCGLCNSCRTKNSKFDAKDYAENLLLWIANERIDYEQVKIQFEGQHFDKKMEVFSRFFDEDIIRWDVDYKLFLNIEKGL
jgi:ATP-dependent DNA helicase RecQ